MQFAFNKDRYRNTAITAKTGLFALRCTVTASTAKTPSIGRVLRLRLRCDKRGTITAIHALRRLNTNSNNLANHPKINSVDDKITQRTKRTNNQPHMNRRIAIPVSEVEFRDFKIQAINKGTTVPKLAREKLFPATTLASNSASKGASHTLTRAEPLDAELSGKEVAK